MFRDFKIENSDSYLDSLENIASTIHREKNTEKVVFFILLNLIEKLDLGYSEGYFFKYDKWARNLKHLNSYYDLNKLNKEDIDFISNYLEDSIDFYGTPIEKMITHKEIQTNMPKLNFQEDYKILNRFDHFTIIPIRYEDTYYGCFVLNRNSFLSKRLTIKEKRVLELFKFNFSLYLHSRELEDFETEDLRLKTVGSFANSIIHELRTPISAIVGFASLAKKKLDEPEKMSRYLEYILQESDKVIRLCEEISDYSSENETTKEKATTFYLSEIIREVFNKLEVNLNKSNIKTYLLVEEDIEVTFYREKVTTAFYHLIKNSIENCDFNKSERFIEITLSNKNFKSINIKDNGIGIQSYKLKEVTIPFYSSKIYGTGLGLTIAKEVFTKLNFSFNIKSEYTKWTNITLEKEKNI